MTYNRNVGITLHHDNNHYCRRRSKVNPNYAITGIGIKIKNSGN